MPQLPDELVEEVVSHATDCRTVTVKVTERADRRPDETPIDDATEAKECVLAFELAASWFGETRLTYPGVRQRIESAFENAKIPVEWLRLAVFPDEACVTVRWSNDPTHSGLTTTLPADMLSKEWKRAGNDNPFPTKAVDLVSNVGEVVRHVAGPNVPHRLTCTPPEVLAWYSWGGNRYALFQGNGAIEYCRVAPSVRLASKAASAVRPHTSAAR